MNANHLGRIPLSHGFPSVVKSDLEFQSNFRGMSKAMADTGTISSGFNTEYQLVNKILSGIEYWSLKHCFGIP